MTNPLILDNQKLQRLPVPGQPVLQMPSNVMLPVPSGPSVLQAPGSRMNELGAALPPSGVQRNELGGILPSGEDQPLPVPKAPSAGDNTNTQLLTAQNNFAHKQASGDGISQIKNPILHGLARTGDVLESILAPGAERVTPGTAGNHQRLLGIDQGQINDALGNQYQEAHTAEENALGDYMQQRPQIEQSKIDQRQTAVQERVGQAAAAKGQTVEWDANGIPTFHDDITSQAYADHQALNAMHQATADKSKIQADIAQNHYIPGTPEFAEAQRKLAQVDKRLGVAMASLGLRAQGLQLRQNSQNADFYNLGPDGQPLPGAPVMTDDEGNQTVVGRRNAGNAIKQQKTVATFNDLQGSVAHTRDALTQLYNEGGSLSDPRIVAAMNDPNSTIGRVINGKLVQGGLTPTQIQAINSVRQLHEQAGILRATTGGTSSEAGAQRILDVVPTAGDANDVAMNKLAQQDEVLKRLVPGQTRVTGGVSVHHPGGKPAMIRAIDPQGVLHEAPAGTPLPQGWKAQ